MRAVITRVTQASVQVDGQTIAELPRPGLLVLAGVSHDDTVEEAERLARKIWGLRILDDELSASDIDAPILVVSQFTLFASTRRDAGPGGARPHPAIRASLSSRPCARAWSRWALRCIAAGSAPT